MADFFTLPIFIHNCYAINCSTALISIYSATPITVKAKIFCTKPAGILLIATRPINIPVTQAATKVSVTDTG